MAGDRVSARCAVIFTAFGTEYDAVSTHLANLDREDFEPFIYHKGYFSTENGEWLVYVRETGQGNVNAALEVERTINHCNPIVVMFVGVAGGLKDVHIGDVVAAIKVYGYESGKASDKSFQPRTITMQPSPYMLDLARHVRSEDHWPERIQGIRPDTAPKAFIEPIAAGEGVVASTESEKYKLLRQSYSDAVAVEMEGLGFLLAVNGDPYLDALVIRGISDLIDGKSVADAQNSQALASRHASAFAFEILAQWRRDRPELFTAQTTITTSVDKEEEKQTAQSLENKQNSSADTNASTTENASTHLQAFIAELAQHYETLKKFADTSDANWPSFYDKRKRALAILEKLQEFLQQDYHDIVASHRVIQVKMKNLTMLVSSICGGLHAWQSVQKPNQQSIIQPKFETLLNEVKSFLRDVSL